MISISKGIGTEYRSKLAKVLANAKGIITPEKVAAILNVSSQEAGRILSRWYKHGWVKRLKRGVYISIAVDDMEGSYTIEDPWVLAASLFSPGYIGGFTAVKHWDFSEQIFETTTFFTAKKIKEKQPLIGSTRFYLKNIVSYKIFGTQIVWRDNIKVLVSDPTKTIVDLLDDPTIVGGMRVVADIFKEYSASKFFNLIKLIDYAEKMNNKTILKRFGFLMEFLGFGESIKNFKLDKKISQGYSLFDPSLKNIKVVRKWSLKIPAVWGKKND